VVEHFLGKEEVVSSILINSSIREVVSSPDNYRDLINSSSFKRIQDRKHVRRSDSYTV